MIKNIMKNIGLKPVEVEEKEEETGGMSKHWVQNGEEATFVERTPEEEMEMWQKVAARQSNDKLKQAIKNREGRELKPVEKIKLEAAKAELGKREENFQKFDDIRKSEAKKWNDFFDETDKMIYGK